MTTSTPVETSTAPDAPARRLKVWHFLVLTAIYLVIVQGANLVLTSGQESAHAGPTSVDVLVRTIVVPVGLAIVLTLGIVAWLGSWQEVFVDRRRLRRWVLVVPVALFLTVAGVTHYGGLADKGLAFALLLLVATLMVGFAEELMFRGVGVSVFRRNGYSEFRVGLWTTVIFGLAHGTNIVTAGPSALLQVVLTSATGLVFYLILRSTGALVIAMAAHGLWDFAILSTQVDPDDPSPLVYVAVAVLAAILLLALIRRRHLTPPSEPAEPAAVTA